MFSFFFLFHFLLVAAIRKRARRLASRGNKVVTFDVVLCDKAMGSWLKDAPTRYKNGLKRLAKMGANPGNDEGNAVAEE